MTQELDFFKTVMPDSREADFYLGCLDGCVFIDFNITSDKLISLSRISFDGYGCCNLIGKTNLLSSEKSHKFIEEVAKDEMDQKNLTLLVREIIAINKDYIWPDALEEYNLIEKNK